MKLYYIPLVFSLFIAFFAKAQNKAADEYRIKLDAFRAMHPPAMIYFHLDKAAYSAGDSMRFKGYQVENEEWKPRTTPQFVDIEIVNLSDNQIVTKQQVVLDNGIIIGALQLPSNIKTGFYRFKADSYLMNFDAENIDFQYDFKVLGENPFSVKTMPFEAVCFAEGGNLVQGILSRITIKANEDTAGKLINEKGDSLASFTVQGGFASFKFKPKSTDKLYISLKDKRLALPEVQKTGIIMTIENPGNGSDVMVVVTGKLPEGESEKRVTVMTETNGKTAQYFDLIAVNGKTIQVFPKMALKHGIIRFSLLDANTNILSERLIYNHAPNLINFSCNKQIKDLGKELEVTLNIDAIDSQGKAIESNISISVIDSLNKAENIDFQDIVNSFTIQQNFTSRISNLEKYFNNNRLVDPKAIDFLMLTQKLGRYNWEEVKNYVYKPLDVYRAPYADERRVQKPRSFEAKNGLYYWNPEIILQNGKGSITFKVPKSAKLHYQICGFDRNGNIGSSNF